MKIRSIRTLLYSTLAAYDKLRGRKNPKILVLCYHSIKEGGGLFSISLETLKKQISLLEKSYNFITARDLNDYLDGKSEFKDNKVLLTFDDGYKNNLDVTEFLKEKNIKPTIFVLSNTDKVNAKCLGNNEALLNKQDLMKLVEYGWDIGSHTATHPDLQTLNEMDLVEEVKNSKINLEETLGIKVQYFSYPKGRYNKKIEEITKESGYDLAFTMDDTILTKNTNKFLIPRVGIDITHKLNEFEHAFSPSVIMFRNIIKIIFGKNLDKLLNI